MKKELPKVNIAGDEFEFDIDRIALIEKANPANEICFGFMTDRGSHYEFDYHRILKCSVYEHCLKHRHEKDIITNSTDVVRVTVPRISVLDPDGMCRKYNCTVRDMAFKSDFEIIVDQEAFAMRMRGFPVMIDLVGKRYEVDVFNYALIPLIGEEPIYLGDLQEKHFLEDKQALHLFYDQEKHTAVDRSTVKSDSNENLVILEIPELNILDPIGKNFLITNNPRLGLIQSELKLHYVARQVPLSQYGITTKQLLKQQLDDKDKQKVIKKRKSKGL